MKEKRIVESLFRLDENDKRQLCGVAPAVCCCESFALMLHSDGRVSFAGGCVDVDTASWENVIKLSAGKRHIAALTADGRVLCAGDNSLHQCETSDWTGITDIFTGSYITFGTDARENLCFAGGFAPGRTDMPAAEKGKSATLPYRMPSEDISDYGSMVDFTNKILGI